MLTVMLFSFSAVAGCNSQSSEQTQSQEQTTADDELIKVSFGTSPWPTSMFAYLADEKGFFAENGLEVDLNTFGSFGDSLQAFVGGNLDIITAASPDTLAPFSQGADFQIIMMTDKSMGSDGMVASKDITSISDLAGKTVATELYSVDHMYLLSLLDEAGMSADDITLTNMTIADAGTAFIAGQVDAAVIWEPYLSRAVSEGDGNLLYSTKDNPDLITDCVAVSAKLLDESPKAIQAFVDSWYQAVEYWQENTDEANEIMAEALEVSAEDFADMMETLYITTANDSLEAFEPAEGESSFITVNQSIAEFLKNLNVIENMPEVSEMINTEFLKNSSMLK
jgi:NitT/TauT family transport system substrate-binding protein